MTKPAEEGPSGARAPRSSPQRRVENVVIGAFLVVQVVVPLSYYAGDDRRDERFAWRMFSATRLDPCDVSVIERAPDGTLRSVDPLAEVHAAWYAMMRRGRVDVIRAYLLSRCGASQVAGTRLSLTCRGPQDQEPKAWDHDCASGRTDPP